MTDDERDYFRRWAEIEGLSKGWGEDDIARLVRAYHATPSDEVREIIGGFHLDGLPIYPDEVVDAMTDEQVREVTRYEAHFWQIVLADAGLPPEPLWEQVLRRLDEMPPPPSSD